MLVTHHLLRETPPAPGLTPRLIATLEPRRRRSLPEEALCERAPPTHWDLSLCDCAFATERRQVLLKPPSRRVPTREAQSTPWRMPRQRQSPGHYRFPSYGQPGVDFSIRTAVRTSPRSLLRRRGAPPGARCREASRRGPA